MKDGILIVSHLTFKPENVMTNLQYMVHTAPMYLVFAKTYLNQNQIKNFHETINRKDNLFHQISILLYVFLHSLV